MSYTTLISTSDLARHLYRPDWVVVDCRFSLDDTERGREDYLRAHIPGAVYAHLGYDLSGPVVPGRTGRHPLPPLKEAARTFSNWGISDATQVVAYDDSGGSIAARFWWMLRFLGHDAVAVLDGGWPAWWAEKLPVHTWSEANSPRDFEPRTRSEWIVDSDDVERLRQDPSWVVLDARDAERFRGEIEPIDPVAGHIPGAVSAPFKENLDAGGRFLSQEELRQRFGPILGDTPAARVVSQCGSGVTACHNLLALSYAGLGDAKLYPGSWSEWITDPSRAVETNGENTG